MRGKKYPATKSAKDQAAKGGVWNGGGWNRQITGPEIYSSGPEISSKIPCCAAAEKNPRKSAPPKNGP